MEFAIDAGKVNTREEGWKDLKIGVVQKREAAAPVAPEGWEQQRLPAPKARLAFARIAPAKQFRQSWRVGLRLLGVVEMARLHVLADGASWIWKAVGRVLTGCQQTLDIYHACEKVGTTARRLFGEETAAARAAFTRGRSLRLRGGWTGVCTWVGELLAVADDGEREKRRGPLDPLIAYFGKHISRLDYASRLRAGQAIGSGSVEGQAKTMGLRWKARGARWRKKNVRRMAALVCVRHSDQWIPYWKKVA